MIERRHQCLIYDGPPAERLSRLVPILLNKIDAHFRCLFLGSPTMVARMRAELASVGMNVSEEIQKKRLILTSDQSHLVDGKFDTKRMLSLLAQTVDQALADGFKGLWATGDMSWEFGTEKNLKKLLEYECGLEKLFQTKLALSGICQYYRDTLPLQSLSEGLMTHPSIYISHTLQRVNPYYIPPEALQTVKPPMPGAVDIERMIIQLTHPEHPGNNLQ